MKKRHSNADVVTVKPMTLIEALKASEEEQILKEQIYERKGCPLMNQRHFRIHDVILRIYPENITKEIKAHNVLEALQGYTDKDFLYMHTVDGNTLEIGIYDEREVK